MKLSILHELEGLESGAIPAPWEYGNEAVWNAMIDGEGSSPKEITAFCDDKNGHLIAASQNNLKTLIDCARLLCDLYERMDREVGSLRGQHIDSCQKREIEKVLIKLRGCGAN